MLDNHFLVASNAKTSLKNTVFYKNYRISVLKEKLIRIEKSSDCSFLDLPTKAVLFRDFGLVEFTYSIKNDGIEIKTNSVTYFVSEEFENSYVLLDGKKALLDNKDNLKGTYSGLDGCDGDVNDHYANPAKPLILENGVCSKSGVAVLDDSNSQYLDEQGIFHKIDNRIDVYVFAYGHEYQEAVKAFYDISGSVPMLPRYALGNWWSRYHEYKDSEYLELMDKFINKNIPICVATIDTDWHPSGNIVSYYKIDELDRMKLEYGFNKEAAQWLWGWTGYSWDLTCFKNPVSFLKKIHSRGLKTCLNLHPNTICWYEKEYPTFAKHMGVDPQTLKPIPLDFSNPNFINSFYNDLHKNLEHEGVDFWWIDDNNFLFEFSHYYYLDSGKEKQPLILCRYAGVGSHRYPIGFSGDSVISWKSLDFLPYFTSTSSNIGYSWWSHDIGAFMAGVKDDELYLRYVQFGVFSPILRLHCQNNVTLTKEPWAYRNGIGEIACDYLRLRHRMIPYLYSASCRNNVEKLALIEPLYYYYPENENAYLFKNEYMFNGNLLVAPITKHSKNKLSLIKVFVPEGTWTDIFTNDVYKGNKVITMVRDLNSIPVLAKQGTIFVLSNDKVSNSIANPKSLEVNVFNGNSTFTLYEDNEGKNPSYTFFETSNDKKKQYLSIMFNNQGAIPENRTMVIKFKNIFDGKVFCNQKASVKKDDCLQVTIKNIDSKSIIELQVEYKQESDLDILKRQARDSIITFEGVNDDRVALYDNLMAAKTKQEFLKIVNNSKINKYYKYRLKECK